MLSIAFEARWPDGSHLYQDDLQTTPHQFWDRLRIEQAQNRLRQPDIRIKEVAIDLGFKHLSHFSKWFKRHTGTPPQAVRERGNWQLNGRHKPIPEGAKQRRFDPSLLG